MNWAGFVAETHLNQTLNHLIGRGDEQMSLPRYMTWKALLNMWR